MSKLPTNWKTSALGEIANTQLGKMLNKGKQTGKSTVPYLRNLNVQWGRIDIDDLNTMDIELNERDKYTVKKGDLLVCEGGESGRAAIWQGDEFIGFQNALHRIRPSVGIETRYLLYYFEWIVKNGFIDNLFNGVTIKHFPQENLRSVKISYPPIVEQNQIVEILEDYLSRLNAALADVKQAKEKVVQFRTSYLRSVFTGTRDWSKIALKDLGAWSGGGTPSKSNSKFWTDGTVPWLSPKDMGPFDIKETQDKITESAVSESTVKKIAPRSIAFVVRSGILERKLPIALTGIETTLNQDMRALTCNPRVLPRFAMHAFVAFEQDILTSCRKTGTTVASINTKSLMNYSINIPDLSLQKSILREVESQIALLDESARNVENLDSQGNRLRRSLFQAAFTGQLTPGGTHV